MTRRRGRFVRDAGSITVLVLCTAALSTATAQQAAEPTARLVPAPRLVMPGAVDSSIPMVWDLVDGAWELFAFASWGGVPAKLSGRSIDHMQRVGPATMLNHPGHGIWIESIIPDESGTWYGYYHHETPAQACGRLDRFIPRIGAARSTDHGSTWEDLGIVLEAAPATHACRSTNAYVLGGVGDVTATLDRDRQDVYLYFSQYHQERAAQGVAVARIAWADRDAPVGKAAVWQGGVWLPAQAVAAEDGVERWDYPVGTPMAHALRPWHDGDAAADVFWGASIHWNTYLERYVMLLNRARDERFSNEGIYVSFASVLDDPGAWSVPRKIMNGGNWYPQVAGLDAPAGTDKLAGQRARFFLTGRSEHYIEFRR
jgi:hypothetical protein